jgi:hypothetical protein
VDVEQLLKSFDRIKRDYSCYEKVAPYLDNWTVDALLYVHEYDKAWDLLKKMARFQPSDVLNVRARCTDTTIDGHDLLRILGVNSLTPFAQEHQDSIAEIATLFLKDFHKEYGKNFVEYFCSQFSLRALTETDIAKLKGFFPNNKHFRNLVKASQNQKEFLENMSYQRSLFSGVPLVTATSHLGPEGLHLPYIVVDALKNEGKRIMRECENTFREESNIPKIGEGWVSETQLFYKLRDEFPDETVVHHGRLSWLSRQHLDIYFPLKNIGCEYQGAQHDNPVDYFGGEESFKKVQELDARKKRLCKKHGCELIYVYEGYDFETVRLALEDKLRSGMLQ